MTDRLEYAARLEGMSLRHLIAHRLEVERRFVECNSPLRGDLWDIREQADAEVAKRLNILGHGE